KSCPGKLQRVGIRVETDHVQPTVSREGLHQCLFDGHRSATDVQHREGGRICLCKNDLAKTFDHPPRAITDGGTAGIIQKQTIKMMTQPGRLIDFADDQIHELIVARIPKRLELAPAEGRRIAPKRSDRLSDLLAQATEGRSRNTLFRINKLTQCGLTDLLESGVVLICSR